MYVLGRIDATTTAALAEWRFDVSQALDAGRAYRTRIDSLQAVELEALATADTAQAAARSHGRRLTALLDSLEAVLPPDTSGPSLADLVAEVRAEYEVEIERRELESQELRRALLTAGQRAKTAEARVLKLEGLLERGQRITTCKIAGLLPCPSRTTSLISGVILGGIAVYAAK
jgi:DNA repair exonuclease SbcCD ATPase subunit